MIAAITYGKVPHIMLKSMCVCVCVCVCAHARFKFCPRILCCIVSKQQDKTGVCMCVCARMCVHIMCMCARYVHIHTVCCVEPLSLPGVI